MRTQILILNCDSDRGEFVDSNLANLTHGAIFDSELAQRNVSVVTMNAYEGIIPDELAA